MKSILSGRETKGFYVVLAQIISCSGHFTYIFRNVVSFVWEMEVMSYLTKLSLINGT